MHGVMPKPSKPCEGKLSELTLTLLGKNRDRSRWGTHACQVCGQTVGVLQVNGYWVPERHWPSVIYRTARKGAPGAHKGKRAAPIPKGSIPPVLPVSPLSVECPHCKAKPGHDRATDSGVFSVMHLARITNVAGIKKKSHKD